MSGVTRPARWRNIAIFTAMTLVLGNIAGANMQAAEGLGGLVFILVPTVTALALRAFGGDGWGDAGFGWGRQPLAYVFAILFLPLLFAIALFAGMAAGATMLAPGVTGWLPAAVLAMGGVFLLYGLLEEIGWRGYLEPRLAALGVAAVPRHALVGLIWALWHIGYIVTTPGYTPLAPALFWPLVLVAIIAMAFVHGWLRAQSGSVWPNVLLHGVGNAVAAPLIDPANVVVTNHLLFDPRLEGLVVLGLLLISAIVLMRRA